MHLNTCMYRDRNSKKIEFWMWMWMWQPKFKTQTQTSKKSKIHIQHPTQKSNYFWMSKI
jgi:hypothetical protein